MTKRSCCWPLPFRRSTPYHVSLHTLPFSNSFITPTARKCFRSILNIGISLVLLVLLILWLGAEYEYFHIKKAADTSMFYNQDDTVCAIIAQRDYEFQTVNRDSDPQMVAHCGSCGACSTQHDIAIYDETRDTLFEASTKCAKLGLIWGRRTATRCMEERVGFTGDCENCWVENILCDLKLCIFSCLWYGMFNSVDGGAASSKALNICTECDEKRCGPAFLACAGANRRRSGILSDIERDVDLEVCNDVTPEWWKDPDLSRHWQNP